MREPDFRQAIIFNDTCMIQINNNETQLRMQPLNGETTRFITTPGVVFCIDKFNSEFILTAERDTIPDSKPLINTYVGLWRIQGFTAELVARSPNVVMRIGTVKSIGFNLIVAFDEMKTRAIVYRLRNGSFEAFFDDTWPFKDMLALSEDQIVFIDPYGVFTWTATHGIVQFRCGDCQPRDFMSLRSLFWIKPGKKLGVFSQTCILVFDLNETAVFASRITAREMCGSQTMSEFIALDESRFACAANNQVQIFKFE